MLDCYVRVVQALDEIGAPYMIVGAYGGSVFGVIRSTNDIDILVDLQEKDCYAISEKFPLPRYYADPQMIRNSKDIYSILYFCLRGFSNDPVDIEEVAEQVARIGWTGDPRYVAQNTCEG